MRSISNSMMGVVGVAIDELLRSDEELTKKVIGDSRQLAYPRLKVLMVVAGIGSGIVKEKYKEE